MAYLTLQITAANVDVGSFNAKLQSGDSSKKREAINGIITVLEAIEGGLLAAQVVATSSTIAGTVSGQTGGVTVTLNLT